MFSGNHINPLCLGLYTKVGGESSDFIDFVGKCSFAIIYFEGRESGK